MANRANQIQARVANRQAVSLGNGGVTAPARTAKSPTTGLGQARVAPNPGRLGQAQPAGPAPKAAPAPASAAPAAPPATLPWDSQFQLAAGGAEQHYGNKLAYLGSQKLLAKQSFGIDPQFADAATNPYSRAALLKNSYDTNVRGSTNSYAARGQLYAGSLRNAQTANQSNYNQGYDTLNKEYLASLGSISQEEAQALEDRENAVNEAGWRRLETAQNAPIEPAPGGNVNKGVKAIVKTKRGKQKVAIGGGRAA